MFHSLSYPGPGTSKGRYKTNGLPQICQHFNICITGCDDKALNIFNTSNKQWTVWWHTVFPRMSAPVLILSTIEVPLHWFNTQRSNETHYFKGKRSSSFDPALLRDQAVISEQVLKRGNTVGQSDDKIYMYTVDITYFQDPDFVMASCKSKTRKKC